MIKTIRSMKLHNTFWKEEAPRKSGGYNPSLPHAVVNTRDKYQKLIGFGGAFTEAAAYNLSLLSKPNRDKIVKAYFDQKTGLGYNLGRVHINSSDFALGNYTYVTDDDPKLSSFDISHEDKYVVPFIRAAEKAAGAKISLLASPWSPPAFMKTTPEMNYGGKLRRDMYGVWAEYFVRFIKEMQKRGVNIWAVTVQNEPEATQTWDSCEYTAEDERDFISGHLISAFEKNKLDVKIVMWDHNRDHMVERAAVILADKKCRDKVWGTGYHWYVSPEHQNLTTLKMLYPDKHIIFTEGCIEFSHSKERDTFTSGQRYGKSIINDFNNYNEAFIDWNLILDSRGGPNHVDNFCEAPVMIDENADTVTFNPSYYFIGHFSRFIKPGAMRLGSSHNAGKDVFMTAFQNPDGSVVAVVQNDGWVKNINLVIDGVGTPVALPHYSITTFILDK